MKRFPATALLAAVMLAAAMILAGCSDGITTLSSEDSADSSTDSSAGATPEPSPEASASTMPETTVETGSLEGGLGEEPEVVLRVEGDSGVTFSGLCKVGEEDTVLGGPMVPKRYTFDPKGERLSCEIQKKDQGDGALKVILLANGSTHSVQQINGPGATIEVSYDG